MTTFKIEDVRVDVFRDKDFIVCKRVTHKPSGVFLEIRGFLAQQAKSDEMLVQLKKMVEDENKSK